MGVHYVKTEAQRAELISALLLDVPLPFTASIAKGVKRSQAQNNTIHQWFTDIAKQTHEAMMDVKAHCNMTYGRPILLRDDAEWCEVFEAVLRPLPYPLALRAVKVLDVPFTRRMRVKQLTEYMDAMSRDYRQRGIWLTDPEAMKYERKFA